MLPSRSPLPMPIPISLQKHALHYPTLARVARDYLAIQGSAVKCERAFSSSIRPDHHVPTQLTRSANCRCSSDSQVCVCQQPHLCDRGSSQACIGMIALFFSHSCHSVMISPDSGLKWDDLARMAHCEQGILAGMLSTQK